jgi:hypothetical protein
MNSLEIRRFVRLDRSVVGKLLGAEEYTAAEVKTGRMRRGWLAALRQEEKTGKWPFKKGEYGVTYYPSDFAGNSICAITVFKKGSYRSARAALKAGVKELETTKPQT